MKHLSLRAVFLLLILSAAVFVYATSGALPSVVGSHFTQGGDADGFMPRGDYRALMLGTVIGVPLCMVLLSSSVRLIPIRFINLPNRDYWLAPDRRAESIAYLSRQGAVFGLLITGFLCFIHWLVALANRQQPPHFPESLFAVGFTVFILATIVWLILFFAHFLRRV